MVTFLGSFIDVSPVSSLCRRAPFVSQNLTEPEIVPVALQVAVAPQEPALTVAVALERAPARNVRLDHDREHLVEPELEEGVGRRQLHRLGREALGPLARLA